MGARKAFLYHNQHSTITQRIHKVNKLKLFPVTLQRWKVYDVFGLFEGFSRCTLSLLLILGLKCFKRGLEFQATKVYVYL